ncbi:MAG: hypothetical protein U9R47_05245, partial [Actinomycetota bacterium]|nr:hypothetical protein [Actinomycetota bacterium]
VFVAVPLFFLGVAWVLRTRTGLPVAASAIGLIGGLTVPVMLSALFRDWAPFPPDLHGSDRYWGYALVGVISALIYFFLATRQVVYAYLIPPILWAAAGSLGLYWRDGMSGAQLITVLAAIVISLAIASRFRTGRIGGLLAVPTVRAAVVVAPFVFVMSLVFAYEDAVRSGVETPGIEEMAQPGAMAAGLLALVLGLASSMEFAWQELGPRTRAGLRVSLRVLAYVAAGVAVMLALALEVTPAWIGVALVGYGIAVLGIDHLVKGTGDAALWIARGTILVGLVMAATEPIPALIVWSAALLVAIGRALFPAVRTWTSPLLRSPADPVSWLAELWVPAFVLVGSAARIVDTPAAPRMLLIAAAVMAATRWLPQPVRAVRTYAEFPATTVALASLGLAVWVHLTATPYTDGEAGVLALGFAGVAALVWVSWTWRAPLAVGSAIVGTALVIAGRYDPAPAATVMVETVVLIVPGVVLMVASFVPVWRRWAYPNGLLGHLCLYGAVAAGVRAEEAAFVALAALVATHAVEAIAVQRGTNPFIEEAAGLAGPGRSAVEFAPGAIAAVAAMPLAILAGRRVPWLREERARFSLVLGALAWAYAAAAAWLRRPGRWLFITLAYLSTAGAVAVAFPSRPASLVAVAGAALVTFALAAILRRPGASTLSWILGLVAVVLVATQLGMDRPDLYRPLYASAAALVVGGGALNTARGRGPGITDRWIVPAVLVGLVGLPISLSFSIAADSWTWMLAAGAAGAVAFLGWAAGAGGVTAAVAAYVGIAYADALSSKVNIFFDEPIYWMIFAAALVLVSGILPGRSGWRILHDASPGALLAGLASAVMAVALAYGTDSEVAVLALSSLLLAGVWLLRRNDHWLHAGIAVLVLACAVEGGGWLPAGLALAALMATAMAELRRNRVGGVTYPWVAVVLWASAYAFFADWAGWNPQTVTVVTFCAGAILSVVALSVWLSVRKRPWIRRWLLPVAALGQVGLLGAVTYATAMLDSTEALLTLAVALGLEAVLIGIYATIRTDPATAWAATVLIATAYGLYADALLTEPVDLLWVTGPIGAALLAGWAALAITNRP